MWKPIQSISGSRQTGSRRDKLTRNSDFCGSAFRQPLFAHSSKFCPKIAGILCWSASSCTFHVSLRGVVCRSNPPYLAGDCFVPSFISICVLLRLGPCRSIRRQKHVAYTSCKRIWLRLYLLMSMPSRKIRVNSRGSACQHHEKRVLRPTQTGVLDLRSELGCRRE